jgi:hypothetical protein
MLEFGGHGQNARTKGVARSAGGVGSLFGMSALDALAATRTVAGLDVELSDQGRDGRQIGLVLHEDLGIEQFYVAIRTEAAVDGDGAVDLFQGVSGPQLGLVPWALARLLATAEVSGLPVRLAACLVDLLAETVLVHSQFGQAALQVSVVVSQLVHLIPQAC